MRIAYLISQYPATSHTFIRREITAVRQLGLKVDTFSIRPPALPAAPSEEDVCEAQTTYTLLERPWLDYFSAHGQEVIKRPLRYIQTFISALRHRPPGARALLLSIAHFGEGILLASELRKRGITHLHNHFANSGATVGLLASLQAEIAWSFTIHGISEFDYPAGLTLPEKVAAARFVACASYFGRAQAARLVSPQLWPKLNVVRCGLGLQRLPRPTGDRSNEVQLIAVGRLSAEKGFAGLLEALSLMVSTPVPHLTIVGDGALKSELLDQAKVLGMSDRVSFLGALSEAETLQKIAHSDVLVLPSFMEGLPIVLMEALALGVPVVAARVAGIPELVEEERTGLLFSPSNWPELAEALDRLVADPTRRRRMAEAGPPRIAQEFDVRISAAKLRDLFHQAETFEATPQALPSSAAGRT